MYNEGPGSCVVDLAEVGMGDSGADLCVEHKVWDELVAPNRASPSPSLTYEGATHAWGNTEAQAIWLVLGVAALLRGDGRWDPCTGQGTVGVHNGNYHDALTAKRNTVILTLHNLFGGFAPGAYKRLVALSKRAIDRTDYESWAAPKFVPYWAQRISAAVVCADARRCLRRLPGLKGRAATAAHYGPAGPGRAPRAAARE